ncbi:MAG: hypothetical protein WCA48_05225 [Pseudomonas gingeri]
MLVDINSVHDRMLSFWGEPIEINLEHWQPTAINSLFYSLEPLGWSAKITELSENVQQDLIGIQALLDLISDDAQPQPRGLIGDEGLGREAFDRLEADADEVVSVMPECKVEFSGPHDCNHTTRSESALAAKQLDAYSELTDSDFGWRIDDALLPYILDMAA